MNDITFDVRAYPIDEPQKNTLAFASVAFKVDGKDLAAIRGIRVVDSEEKGPFVSMPQSKDKDGEYHDIAFPLTKELRDELSAAVLDETYRQAGLDSTERGYAKPEKGESLGIQIKDVNLDVRVFPLDKSRNNTLAFASVAFNVDGEDVMAIRGLRIVDSEEKGLFVSMPQSKDKDNKFHDVAFPLTKELRKEISKSVLAEYGTPVAEKKKGIGERLAAGKEKSAQYVASAPARSASKSQQTALGA